MGHVLLATPTIERLLLHDALVRGLQRRGHTVTTLCRDAVTRRCYETHGLRVRSLDASSAAADLARAPLPDLAARDARLRGIPPGLAADFVERRQHRLDRDLAALLRVFETEHPDLVVLVDARDGFGRLVHWVAREFGSEVVHLGEGLVPGTLQRDDEGLDGDGTAVRRAAAFYRTQRADEALLHSVLAASLGGLPPRPPGHLPAPWPPDLLDLASSLFAAVLAGEPRLGVDRLAAWHRIARRPIQPPEPAFPELPDSTPFLGVLLQHPRDPRVCLDHGQRPDPQPDLVGALRRALMLHGDPSTPIVVVPPAGLDARRQARLAVEGPGPEVRVVDPSATGLVAATAAALWTVNHPGALLGILAGTPVLHLGSAPWAVPGVATRTTLADLPAALEALPGPDHETLRARVASRLLRDDHVWCAPQAPDPNGLRGLLDDFDERLERSRPPVEAGRYRPGPAWAPGA